MTDALVHRGPDAGGVTALEGRDGRRIGGFGHRRLAILDPSPAGRQPMCTPDGRYTLTYNGEIYNFLVLREELGREGVAFRSRTDTEVLLLGWAHRGLALLHDLRGMFAFALWDSRRERGFLVRDRFGIKPLYYAEVDGSLLFASEVRAIVASGRVPRVLSPAGIHSYLSTGAVVEPLTIAKDVYALPAGTYMEITISGGRVRATEPRPWSRDPLLPVTHVRTTDARSAAQCVRQALRDSVEHHMVSDTPVGYFLSGGIDSSATVALASEVSEGPHDTFTVTFQEAAYNEAVPARAVARRFGTRHRDIPLSGGDLLRALPCAFASMDQPSQDGLNTYVVSRAVREHGIKVVLSGLGGDELFGGYPSFRRLRTADRLRWMPGPMRSAVAGALSRPAGLRSEKLRLMLREEPPARAAYRASRLFLDPRCVRGLTGTRYDVDPPAPLAGLSPVQTVSWYELTGYMRNTLLRDSDVFSMAHGLELRVPFVDREVARAAMAMDDHLKIEGRVSKPVLVRALEDLLPREVWDRPKQGFALPLERWLRQDLRREVAAAFTPDNLVRAGLAPAPAQDLWRAFLTSRRGSNHARPWGLYTLVRWVAENDFVEVMP